MFRQLSSKYIHLRWKPARTGTNFKWNTFLFFLICFIFFKTVWRQCVENVFISCDSLNLSKPIFFCWLDLFFLLPRRKKTLKNIQRGQRKNLLRYRIRFPKKNDCQRNDEKRNWFTAFSTFCFPRKFVFSYWIFFSFFKEQKNVLSSK